MRPLLKYYLRGIDGRIWCHKIEIAIPSCRLGLALRDMAGELKHPSLLRDKEFEMTKLTDSQIAKGKEILERMKMKTFADYIKPFDEELTLIEPKTIWPLKRDPKTGRMMKASKE